MTDPEVKNGSVAVEVTGDCRVRVPEQWRGEFVEMTRKAAGRPDVFAGLEEGVRVEGQYDPEYYDDGDEATREERSERFAGRVDEYTLKPESAGGPSIKVVVMGDDDRVYQLTSVPESDDSWSRPSVSDSEPTWDDDELRVGSWRSLGRLMRLSIVRTV